MGMYTELVLAVELKKDTPESVINILNYMVEYDDETPETENHKLFSDTTRWEFMLRSDSYYFDGITNTILKYDDISKSYYLTVRCNLKNYSDEIELFVEWVSKYVQKDKDVPQFVGYKRYETDNEPELIYI